MADQQTTNTHTTRTERTTVEERESGLFSNILAIIGFIILVVIVIWGLIHAASLSGSWISNIFSKDAQKLTVTAPASVESGTAFNVSWKYDTSSKGIYTLVYQCKSGLQMMTPAQTGMNSIPCGAAFTVSGTSKTISLTPMLTGSSPVSVPVSIVFVPTSGSRVQGTATITVNPGTSVVAAPETKKPETKPTTPAAPVRPATPADLSVRITSATIDSFGNGVVTFDIANVGGKSTGTWYFEAYLPTQTGYTYFSPAQNPLGPGDHIMNTLNFTQGVPGMITITVDPSNGVSESNEFNNIAAQGLSMPVYPQPQVYPQPYPQYPQYQQPQIYPQYPQTYPQPQPYYY